jgi:hypothetical protein
MSASRRRKSLSALDVTTSTVMPGATSRNRRSTGGSSQVATASLAETDTSPSTA